MGTLGNQLLFLFGQLTAESTGLLSTHVLGKVLGLGKGLLQLVALSLSDDGKSAGDGLANVTTKR